MTLALMSASATPARAVSSGPQPGTTGIPAAGDLQAEPTCVSCHTSFPLNPDDKGALTLEGLPQAYEAGRSYALTLRLSHPDPAVLRWGFQLTAVTMSDLHGAGEWVVTDAATTQVVAGVVADRSYVEHSYGGTAIGQSGGAAWSFTWTAPATPRGEIGFFAAANAANADGSNQGDRIYSKSPAPLALVPAAAH